MQGCFIWLFLLAGGVFVMMTLLRWFEQTAEAVDNGWWNKLALLICMPFAVWLFPGGRVGAGRPTPVAPHEPVRGFGTVTRSRPQPLPPQDTPPRQAEIPVARLANPADVPPPGTPPEFLGMPVLPPKKKPAAVDPDKLAKLKQKMREQGMLGPEE
jgi:hypothetical protein